MDSRLFQPVAIGAVTAPNRLVMPPMVTQYGEKSGLVTKRLVDYYTARAAGGTGSIIVEAASVMPGARILGGQINIYDDIYLPGLKDLARSVKKAGARCFLQIQHGGRRALAAYNGGMAPSAPSPIAQRRGELPRELTLDDIEKVIEAFAESAARAKEAGFDGVELHFAHGYLIAEFLSPLTNKRTDRYGGDLSSRARLAVEIVHRTRERVGRDFALLARICGDECIKGGLGLREAQKIALMLEEAGLDALDVSAGYTASHEEGYLSCYAPASVAPMSMPRGNWVRFAEGVKQVVRLPVIAVGRLEEPGLAEEVIASGKADLVAIGRGLIADPAFAAKLQAKQYKDIRRCLACNTCAQTMYGEGNLRCAVNAEAGMEGEYRLVPAAKRKRVLVIGGGPGGMEAARVAATRGHKVTLAERKPRLGGNMVAAAAVDFKRDISLFTDYLSYAIDKAGVEVLLNTDFEQGKVLALKPDAVILATGASPVMPQIPGAGGRNVTDAIKVLEGGVKTGRRVVVVGGGMTGCEAAVLLAKQGKEVTIVSRRETDFSDLGGLAPDMESIVRRWFLIEHLPTLPIDIVAKSTYKEVTGEGLVVEDRDGKKKLLGADTVVFALGLEPNNGLKKELEGKMPELFEVGDCLKPRKIMNAVHEAYQVSRSI